MMAADLSPDSIPQVARAKTLKYGFVGLPVGGAKAGIAADPEMPQEEKREVLKTFGQMLKPFLITGSYVPFVANCGGVLGISMKRAGLKGGYIRHLLEHRIGEQVTQVIEAADREKVTPRVYAERIAEERFLRIKAAAEKRSIAARAFNFALELYRRGVIPYQVVTPFASRYFEKRLGRLT